MDKIDTLKLVNRLHREFLDEDVEVAISELSSNELYWALIEPLRLGRNAASLSAKIDEQLRNRKFKFQAKSAQLDDNEFFDLVRAGQVPETASLSAERKSKLLTELRKVVSGGAPVEDTRNVIIYLLDAGRGEPFFGREFIGDVTDWCIRQQGTEYSVLQRLLWLNPPARIYRVFDTVLENCEWTTTSRLLLSSMMYATGKKQNRRWFQLWFEKSEPSRDDGMLLATFVLTTGGSRRAIDLARDAVSLPCSGYMKAADAMLRYYHRKSFQRGFDRDLKRNIRIRTVHQILPSLLRRSASKKNLDLAKEALKLSNEEDGQSILLEMIRHTTDSDIIQLAKQRADRFPNAPDSFKLMSALIEFEPKVAGPWLLDWVSTALPEQACYALTRILQWNSSLENHRFARVWLDDLGESRANVSKQTLAKLVRLLEMASPF